LTAGNYLPCVTSPMGGTQSTLSSEAPKSDCEAFLQCGLTGVAQPQGRLIQLLGRSPHWGRAPVWDNLSSVKLRQVRLSCSMSDWVLFVIFEDQAHLETKFAKKKNVEALCIPVSITHFQSSRFTQQIQECHAINPAIWMRVVLI
jgi:hypothetical protein